MKPNLTLCLIGGDERYRILSQKLQNDGHKIITFAQNALPNDMPVITVFPPVDAVILPMPLEKESGIFNAPLAGNIYETKKIFDWIKEGSLVFSGGTPPKVQTYAQNRSIKLIDYLSREELAIGNAIPTCEGAVQIAMEQLDTTIHSSKALVIGYGRIGRMLADMLSSLHASVTVSARKAQDFAWIASKGYNIQHTNSLSPCDFDVIFNTVPAPVITENVLKQIKDSCIIIDLASRPGGVDFEAAERLSKNTIWALSLPGKVAPVSAAQTIKSTIYTILQEEGLL